MEKGDFSCGKNNKKSEGCPKMSSGPEVQEKIMPLLHRLGDKMPPQGMTNPQESTQMKKIQRRR